MNRSRPTTTRREVTLRSATPEESACIARLDSKLFPYAGLTPRQVSYYRRKAPKLILVADARHGSVVGYVIGSITRRRKVTSLYIVSMGVLPGWRRKGLGRRLLRAAARRARGIGAARIKLEVWTRNRAALKLYRALGFEPKGTRRDYYEPGRDAFTMERRLR